MFEKFKEANPQVIIRRANANKVLPQPTPIVKERKSRYGKRFLTIRGKSIIADYHHDGTTTMYVIEDGTKALLPVVKNVPRDKARETALSIATLMESYEKISARGNMTLELIVSR